MTEDEGKSKESIWSINPNWRGLFYGVLSFCGIAVSAFTLYEKWGNGWLEIFNEIRNGIVSSVVVVWFVFQVADWATLRVKTLFIKQFMAWGDPFREALREKARQEIRREARQEGRREAQDLLRKWIEDDFRKQGKPEEEIQRFLQQLDALGKIEKKH